VHAMGKADDAVAEADALRLARDEGEEGLGCAHVRVPLETVVLDGPHAIEARLLGEHGLLDTVQEDLMLEVARRIVRLSQEDHRELHGRSLLSNVRWRFSRAGRPGARRPG